MNRSVQIELSAVIFRIQPDKTGKLALHTLCRSDSVKSLATLPAGPFDPNAHRTFERAVRDFVHAQTGFKVGYVEQLYSFGDEGRIAAQSQDSLDSTRLISISYLALVPRAATDLAQLAQFQPVFDFFPYEDWRHQDGLAHPISSGLEHWARASDDSLSLIREARLASLFNPNLDQWNDERALERFELLFEAGLVQEAGKTLISADTGIAMASDHRRIVATALSRLRGKLKYRPVIFDMMPPEFTLFELQKSLEAISGLHLHKQNFRRGLERGHWVLPTGQVLSDTGGRPAALYRYNAEAHRFNRAEGLSLPRL